jgi:PAS domain S-box-containing protein
MIGVRNSLRRPAWLLYLTGGALGGLAYYFLPRVAKSGPFFNLLGVSSVIAILVGIRMNRPKDPAPWFLFAVGQAFFIAGDVITYNYPSFFGHDIPFPSIGDVFYLAVYPCLIAGILMLIRERRPGRDRDSFIDSLIITIPAGLLAWEFWMGPYAHDHTLSLPVKLVSMAYPLMDLLLLAVVVRLAVGSGRREPSFFLLSAAAVALVATDTAYGLVQLSGAIYQNGGPLEAGWLSFYLLWAAAALHPSMRTIGEPVPEHELKHPRRRLAILAAACLVSPAVNVVQTIQGHVLDPGIVSVCSAAIFLLVFVRMNGLMVDITEYRRTANQLRETEAKYRNLVESLPAIVYTAEFGVKGRWLYVSPQIGSILGFTPEEWVNRPEIWHKQVHPDDLSAALEDEKRVLKTGEALRCEYRIRARNGRVVWIREEAMGILGEGAEPGVLQGVMYDITDEKAAEQTLRVALQKEQKVAADLRELNEMKNSFLQAVSHDLRTPLTSIMGSALTLKRTELALSAEDATGLMEIIASNAVKLNRLLNDLLDVDRLSRGLVEPQRSQVDLRAMVDRVLRECELEGRAVEVDVPVAVASIDPSQVERILENLVTNATRYTPTGSPIWVRAQMDGTDVLLVVEDAGPGVPYEMRETIFEAFRQGREQVLHSPGVGIGLSLVARFAELHGGSAWVEDRPGGGASFRVLLRGETVGRSAPGSAPAPATDPSSLQDPRRRPA